MGRSVLDDLGEEVTGVVTPVSICMALTVALVRILNPTGESPTGGVYLASAYYTEQAGDSAGTKLTGALLNALIFVVVVTVLTFVLVLLVKYGCTRLVYAYMAFSGFSIFFLLGGIIALQLLQKAGAALDLISFTYMLLNFAVVGAATLFVFPAPLLMKQSYLVIVGMVTAYVFTWIPEWTTWVLLCAMAVYDVLAVLVPGGPLRQLVELAQERDQDIPALVYEARPVRRGGRDRAAPALASDTTGEEQLGGAEAPPAGQLLHPGDATRWQTIPRAPQNQPPAYVGPPLGPDEPLPPPHPLPFSQEYFRLQRRSTASAPPSNTPARHNREAAEAASPLDDADVAAPDTPLIFSMAPTSEAPGGAQRSNGSGSSSAGRVGARQRSAQARAAAVRTLDLDAPPQSQAMPGGAGREAQQQHQQQEQQEQPHVQQSLPGVQAPPLRVGAGTPLDPEQAAQLEAHPSEASALGLPEAIKLGLGDFIFYSVLVGRAAMYDFLTVFACYLAIIAGLCCTLLWLAVARHALPALPISIALAVAFYFISRFVMEPVILPMVLEMVYF